MMITYDVAIAILSILVGLLMAGVVVLARQAAEQRRRIARLEGAVSEEPVIGHRIAAALNERATIDQWKAELAKHPEGSPKHTAYLNRLRELGAL